MTLLEIVKILKTHSVPCSIDIIKNMEFSGLSFSVKVPYGSILDAIAKRSTIYNFMPCGSNQTMLVVMAPSKDYDPVIIGNCNLTTIDTVVRAYDVQTNTCY